MKFSPADNLVALTRIRSHLASCDGNLDSSTPLVMGRWLAMQYAKLPRALQPDGGRPAPALAFKQLSAQDKLNRLHEAFRTALAAEDPNPTVPTAWVVWLMGEFDSLGSAGHTLI